MDGRDSEDYRHSITTFNRNPAPPAAAQGCALFEHQE
jgi:hypothetical protein